MNLLQLLRVLTVYCPKCKVRIVAKAGTRGDSREGSGQIACLCRTIRVEVK